MLGPEITVSKCAVKDKSYVSSKHKTFLKGIFAQALSKQSKKTNILWIFLLDIYFKCKDILCVALHVFILPMQNSKFLMNNASNKLICDSISDKE